MYDEIRNKNILNDIIRFILFLAILFGGFWLVNNMFTKDVKASHMEIEPGVYLEMDYTENEYFNNGVDVVMILEVSSVTGDDRVTNFYHYFTQAYDETSKFIFNMPQFYRIELESANNITPVGPIKTLIIDRTMETMTGYSGSDELLFTYYKSDMLQWGIIEIRALRDTTTQMIAIQEAYNNGYLNGVQVGYDAGYDAGYDVGYDVGISQGDYDIAYEEGYDIGFDSGYQQGLLNNPNNDFGTLISTILLGVGTVLGIELLPNITIGAIIAVPIVFGIIAFVLGRKKGD